MKLENKKGIALNQAFGAILAVVLIGVLVIVAILIFVSLGNTFTNLDTTGANAETLDASATVFVAQSPTGNSTLCSYGSFVVVSALNDSDKTAIAAPNFTTTSSGSILFTSDAAADAHLNGTTWEVNYTANWGGNSCVAANDLVTQFATYPRLVGLVGTIIFLGIVIGVLVSSFVIGRRSRV